MRWELASVLVLAMTAVACGGDDSGGGAATGGTGGSNTGGSGGSSTGGTGGSAGASSAFSCLGKVTLPTVSKATLDMSLKFVDPLAATPGEVIKLQICAFDDPDCAKEITSAQTDSSGSVTVTLPMGPNGWEGIGLATASTYLPIRYLQRPPLIPDPSQVYKVPIWNQTVIGAVAQATGHSADPTKGHVVVNVFDCDAKGAAGIALTVNGGNAEAVIYGTAAGPDPKLTETAAAGIGSALNVTTGDVEMVATLVATSQVLGRAHVPVRAGAITQLYLYPTP